MLFNSLEFALFFPLIFVLYWLCRKSLRIQNWLLLVASFYFYACWDWRFLFLLMFSIFICYFTGLQIADNHSPAKRKIWLWIGVLTNLGFLGFFKYCNFFIESFEHFSTQIGFQSHLSTLQIVLPIGISFYTFHGLSYVVDIYNDRIKPTKNIVDYSLFVSFFPLLIAGPIERATHLLPQIKKPRTFEYANAVDGLRQTLWGLFKKMVIADSCAELANNIFNSYHSYNGSTLVLGAFYFCIQIYCDFSGYSDIALGIARLLGFDLLKNFNFPYFARDIAEFWRRWHISLTSWFKDYLYIPLGGSRGGLWLRIRNTFIIFIVSGFWHGANWTFLVWGFLNALFIMPSIIFKTNRKNLDVVAVGKIFPSFKEFLQLLLTFCLATFAWIFFRAKDLTEAFLYIKRMFCNGLFEKPQEYSILVTVLIFGFMIIEWFGREGNYAIEKLDNALKYKVLRWIFYTILIAFIFENTGRQMQFIYFKF